MSELIRKTIAFIPLRGGSKSIPLKNIKLLNGRPLIYWTLDAVIDCEEIDKVVVSTDSEEIKRIVHAYCSSKIVVVSRSKQVSTDIATTESVMLEFAENNIFENIVLVQATSPLLTSKDLQKGFQVFKEQDINSVLSVVRQKRFLWKVTPNGAKALNYDPAHRPRRQEFDGYVVENGAFYITTRERLLKTKCRISGKIGLVEMSEETYYEIDEPEDWEIVEALLKRIRSQKIKTNLKERIRKIKCLLTDSDGVLTDGGMYYSEKGDELKKFNTRDGMGIRRLKEKGYITGIITSENINLVRKRADKLKVDILYLGVKNKINVINDICDKYKLTYEEIAYIGDDINDLEVIKSVGFGCAVHDAMPEVRAEAYYVTMAKGGEGAVREIAELIIGN